jgi:hypothetical protein
LALKATQAIKSKPLPSLPGGREKIIPPLGERATGFTGRGLFLYRDEQGNFAGAPVAEAACLGDDADPLDARNPVIHDLLECFSGGEIEGGIRPVERLKFVDHKINPFHMVKETVGVMGDGQFDLDFFSRTDLFRKDLNLYLRFVGKSGRGGKKEKSTEKKPYSV